MVHQIPDGRRFGTSGEYLEIVPGRRLVNTFVFDGTPDRKSVDTVEFIAVPGGTLVTGVSRHESNDRRDDGGPVPDGAGPPVYE